jgi:ferritin-like metal-binding protein YciE
MKLETLHDVFLHLLHDLYDAEQQLVKALPKMAEACESPELCEAFETHLGQTEEQVRRLEEAFKSLDEKPKRVHCKGMEGLIEEGKELLKTEPSAALDAALIAAAQKVEHYEIASYGTACEMAKLMKHTEALKLLKETMSEEEETDKLLTKIAKDVHAEAMEEEPEMVAA